MFEGANNRGGWPYGLLGRGLPLSSLCTTSYDKMRDRRTNNMTVTLADVAARAQVSPRRCRAY